MSSRRLTVVIVVPCFDEADRLDPDGLTELSKRAGARLVSSTRVDDGTDGTGTASSPATRPDGSPRSCAATSARARPSARDGRALDDGAAVVGYYDADLATPPAEMARLVATLLADPSSTWSWARVGLLGHAIERSMVRHYLGRVFATASSIVLGLDVYDTQCGPRSSATGRRCAAAVTVRQPLGVRRGAARRLHRGRRTRLPASAS